MLPLLLLAAPGDYRDPELTPADRAHWSFVAPVRHPPPAVRDAGRVRNPIDRFVLARLEAAGRTFAPEADRRTLVRRLHLDLVGLPPTPAEADAALADSSPDWYEKLVDRLLASPHHGERWAQHWLDVVRFAESDGYELDADRPHAWRYRDYVARAFNADKPFDRFVTEQIAGDLLAAGRGLGAAELLAATGLHRCGPVHVVSGNLDPAEVRNEVLTEMADAVGTAVLGLTVGCARCHDHKFDPVSLGDYYRLQAFFAGTRFADGSLATAAEKAAHKRQTDAVRATVEPLKKRLAELEAPTRAKLLAEKTAALPAAVREAVATPAGKRTADQKKFVADSKPLLAVAWDEVRDALPAAEAVERTRLRAEQSHLEEGLPPRLPAAWAVADDPTPPPHHVLRRGAVRLPAGRATPTVPRVIAGAGGSGDRRDLARWLTDPANPLTARVIVNRVWGHHFGRGIVGTPNDFGARGELPTHPELLDWLATELVANGWRLKHLHRLVVTSTAYRQRSGPTPDPLVGRQARKRLDAEALRDAILVASGSLNLAVGGPGVRVPLEPEVYALLFTEGEPVGLWPVTPDPREHDRRSLYLVRKRTVRQPLLEAFDQPDGLTSCGVRGRSTFAPQALTLMNGPFARREADRFAASLAGHPDPVGAVFRRTVARPPTPAERAACDEFLRAGSLGEVCLVALNRNEFVHVD